MFTAFFHNAMIDMDISFLLIGLLELSFHCHTIDIIFIDMIGPLIFKGIFVLQYQLVNQLIHSFDHNHKGIFVIIHAFDVTSTKISSIKNKPYFF